MGFFVLLTNSLTRPGREWVGVKQLESGLSPKLKGGEIDKI